VRLEGLRRSSLTGYKHGAMGSEQQLKAAFGVAYARAVGHAAGYFAQDASRDRDDDGVDLELFSRDSYGTVRSPALHLQVKSTARAAADGPLVFDLPKKNYDELRVDGWQVPRILLVVFVPGDSAAWLSCSAEELVLRRAGYWLSLVGQPPTTNRATVRIELPRTNLFDVEAVRSLFHRIREGGLP